MPGNEDRKKSVTEVSKQTSALKEDFLIVFTNDMFALAPVVSIVARVSIFAGESFYLESRGGVTHAQPVSSWSLLV